MITQATLELVQDNEGYRQFCYECTAGKKTIGIGFNLDDVGLSLEESQVILSMRLQKISDSLHYEIDCFEGLSNARQSALCDMAYQMGVTGLLKFKKSIAMLERGLFHGASKEFLDSNWARQTPNRALNITRLIELGEF